MAEHHSESLAPFSQRTAGLPGVITETGYDLPADLTYERWYEIGQALQQMDQSLNWWLGDWWVHGERRHGEMASQAVIDLLATGGRSYKTLQQAAHVATMFPPGNRLPNLSWSHHLAVSYLPLIEAGQWLQRAAAGRWSKSQLLQELREARYQLPPRPTRTEIEAHEDLSVPEARLLDPWSSRWEPEPLLPGDVTILSEEERREAAQTILASLPPADVPREANIYRSLMRHLHYVEVDPDAVAEQGQLTMSPVGFATDAMMLQNYGRWVLAVAEAVHERNGLSTVRLVGEAQR